MINLNSKETIVEKVVERIHELTTLLYQARQQYIEEQRAHIATLKTLKARIDSEHERFKRLDEYCKKLQHDNELLEKEFDKVEFFKNQLLDSIDIKNRNN